MEANGKWTPGQIDEWYRRNRALIEVPVESAVEPARVPMVPLAPEAFKAPNKNHGAN